MDKWGRICPPFATFDGQAENRYLFDFVEKALSPLRVNLGVSPEKKQAFGQAAKRFTIDFAAQKVVTVKVEATDRYGRTVGEVILLDGRSLNRELVRAGYAWWYRKYSSDTTLGLLESEARAARCGLWADPNPVPPWEWRHGGKKVASPDVPTLSFPMSSRECGQKRYCKEMNSCEEAMFFLKDCGLSSLDRDGDGIPCESLCR